MSYKKLLDNIKQTTIDLGNGTRGYFITDKQLTELVTINATNLNEETVIDSEEEFEAHLRERIESLTLHRGSLLRKLALEADAARRTRLNLESQQCESEIARIKRNLGIKN